MSNITKINSQLGAGLRRDTVKTKLSASGGLSGSRNSSRVVIDLVWPSFDHRMTLQFKATWPVKVSRWFHKSDE